MGYDTETFHIVRQVFPSSGGAIHPQFLGKGPRAASPTNTVYQEVKMSTNDFFQEIEHSPVPWRQYQLYVPLFYQEIKFMSVSMLAPLEKIRAVLPSKRMKPYRITPWHSTLSITAYQYRECDIGPYNEVSISIPITIDKQTPLFTGSLRRMPENPMSYSHHLPVTTEIAREVGAEFAGYPKFVADIEFAEEGDWLTCELKADSQNVLTFRGRKLELSKFPRIRINPITFRRGYILRSEFVINERDTGSSRSGEDVELELGEHPIAEELRELNLGRVLGYRYCPRAQGILTPVFESFAG
jgi:hypothetical protein